MKSGVQEWRENQIDRSVDRARRPAAGVLMEEEEVEAMQASKVVSFRLPNGAQHHRPGRCIQVGAQREGALLGELGEQGRFPLRFVEF